MANTIEYPFTTFNSETEKRGYKANKISATGYYIKASNNVRVDFSCQRGGIVSVGYGSNAGMLEAVKDAFVSETGGLVSPLRVEKVLAGQVNFHHETIEKFFELVTLVETIKVPETKGKGGRPKKDIVKAAKDVAKEINATVPGVTAEVVEGNAHSPSGSETQNQAIAALDARKEAKASGASQTDADREAIKAANLQRIREAAEKKAKAAAQTKKDEQIIDEMAPDFDMPAFLLNDPSMEGYEGGRQVERHEGAE